VLFDTGKSALKPEAEATLHEAAQRVKKFQDARVDISGHTDNVGSGRVEPGPVGTRGLPSVKAWFVEREGIPAAALATHGHGSTQPVATMPPTRRARNRGSRW
jgi:outer membrane protein OmpA-like peptidoglycan-associated protein